MHRDITQLAWINDDDEKKKETRRLQMAAAESRVVVILQTPIGKNNVGISVESFPCPKSVWTHSWYTINYQLSSPTSYRISPRFRNECTSIFTIIHTQESSFYRPEGFVGLK